MAQGQPEGLISLPVPQIDYGASQTQGHGRTSVVTSGLCQEEQSDLATLLGEGN